MAYIMTQLTTHFSEAELGVLDCNLRLVTNALYICVNLLEPIREHFNSPITIHDGYRDPSHNARVGGKPNSFHLFSSGTAAADFDVIRHGYQEVFDWIRLKSNLKFDKVILESNSSNIPAALHIQIDSFNPPRREAYTGNTGDGDAYILVETK